MCQRNAGKQEYCQFKITCAVRPSLPFQPEDVEKSPAFPSTPCRVKTDHLHKRLSRQPDTQLASWLRLHRAQGRSCMASRSPSGRDPRHRGLATKICAQHRQVTPTAIDTARNDAPPRRGRPRSPQFKASVSRKMRQNEPNRPVWSQSCCIFAALGPGGNHIHISVTISN